MIWAGVSVVRRTQQVFVLQGVKVSAKVYQDLVLEPEVKHLSTTMFGGC